MSAWNFEAVSIYDQMIGVDEQYIDGKKKKIRGTEETAKQAIEDTLLSAEYYSNNKKDIGTIIYIAQGVTTRQYVEDCSLPLLSMMNTDDWFGFGGFCIIGRMRKQMLPLFQETVSHILPLLKERGIKRAHVFGVCIPEAIAFISNIGKQHGIIISTDSSAPEVNALAFGKGYSKEMRPNIIHRNKWVDYNPIELAYDNIRKYSDWAYNL